MCVDTGHWEKKMAAVNCYQSQFYTGRPEAERGFVVKYVTSECEYFGGTIYRRYAEPFYTTEMLGMENLDGVARGWSRTPRRVYYERGLSSAP